MASKASFLFIGSGMHVPSTRFRILPYLGHLRRAGYRCDLALSWPEKYDYFKLIGWRMSQRLKRSTRLWHAWLAERRQYDAIFLEREVFDDETSDLEERFRKTTKRLVLDLDDGIFLRHPNKFPTIAKMADLVICGNRFLQQYVEPLNSRTCLLPTCVEIEKYPARAITTNANKVVIGWIGTTHNVEFLSVASEALRSLAKTRQFVLKIVAPSPERLTDVDLRGVQTEFVKWDPATEVSHIQQMDIGIMPLHSGQDWMKYKCGLKLLQYLAVGTPGVATPIGVNAEILEDSRVGFAASTTSEWESRLGQLIDDPELRVTLGRNGRQLVAEKFSIEGNWQRLAAMLEGRDLPG